MMSRHAKGVIASAGSAAPLLSFDDLVYVNPSADRYLLDPVTPQVLGPFGANVLAEVTLGGKRYGQFEGAANYLGVYFDTMDNWLKTGSASITADQLAAPNGTLTAEKVIFTANTEVVYRANVPIDAGVAHVYSVWMRAETGTFKLKLSRTNAATWATAAVSAEITLDTTWRRYDLPHTTGGADAVSNFLIGAEEKTPYVMPQTGSIYVWGAHVVVSAWQQSPVDTDSSVVLRNADSAYWPSAVVPAAMRNGPFTTVWIPASTHAEGAAYSMLARYSNAGRYFGYELASRRINCVHDGAVKVQSNPLTFSRHQPLTITVVPSAGTVEVTGATTGDGLVTGTAWAWPVADLEWGMYSTTFHCYGLLREPY